MVGDSMNIIQFLILDCRDTELLKIVYFIRYLLNIAFIVLPIGAAIMLSLDMAKNVIAGKVDDMSKNFNIFIKRLLSLACVFLVYIFVSFVMTFIGDSGIAGTDSWLECWENANSSSIEAINYYDEFKKTFNSDTESYDGWVKSGQQYFDTDMSTNSSKNKIYDCNFLSDNWAGENKGKWLCNIYVPE